jgi:tetratricopeptide (TPR) repeat protein
MKKIRVASFFIISFLLSFISNLSVAQNANIDSLLGQLKSFNEDTNRVIFLNKISSSYLVIGEHEKGLPYLKQALKLSQNLNYKKGEATSYKNMAEYFELKSNLPRGLKNYSLALKVAKDGGDRYFASEVYNKIGSVNLSLTNYAEALVNHYQAIKIQEDLMLQYPNDTINIQAFSQTNIYIGIIYTLQKNHTEAIKSFNKSLLVSKKINHAVGIARAYNALGNAYSNADNHTEALKNYFSAVKIRQQLNDKAGLGGIYGNIGLAYQKQGDYAKAVKIYSDYLKMESELGNTTNLPSIYNNLGVIHIEAGNYQDALKNFFEVLKLLGSKAPGGNLSYAYLKLGDVYTKLKKPKDAEMYLNKALMLSKSVGFKERIKDCYEHLVRLDSSTANYRGAFENHKLYIAYRDSIDNEETKKQSLQASIQYEFDKKEIAAKAEQEKKDVITKQDKQKQKIVISLVSIVLGLVVVFSFFLYSRFRITNRQKLIIEKQKVQVDAAFLSLNQKNKEVMDSINYAGRIQKALLSSEKYISKTINRLKSI